jgi:hypothetical protein
METSAVLHAASVEPVQGFRINSTIIIEGFHLKNSDCCTDIFATRERDSMAIVVCDI